MMNVICSTLLVVATLISLIGCGTKVGTGAVDVEFTNNTAGVLNAEFKSLGVLGFMEEMEMDAFLGVTPTIYQLKLVAMYIVEDMDANQNNLGAITSIWISNKCDAELYQCGIGPAANGYEADYFDFAGGTASVNAILNSFQGNSDRAKINPGTYRYIKMDFIGATGGNDSAAKNFKFGTSTANEVRTQRQAVNIAFTTPLVLAEGDSFTVNLAYDLEKRFYSSAPYYPRPAEVSDSHSWTCNGTGGAVPCVVEAEFSPTVTKK